MIYNIIKGVYISAVKFQILGCSRELQILKFCSRELQIFKNIYQVLENFKSLIFRYALENFKSFNNILKYVNEEKN